MTKEIKRFLPGILMLGLIPICCVAASPWKATEGATLQVTSGYTSTEYGDKILVATGAGSELITNNRLTFNSVAAATAVAYITEEAAINLNDATIVATGKDADGIIAESNGKINVTDSLFAVTNNGRAIYATDAEVAVSGSTFWNSLRKGAIALKRSTLRLTDSSINKADAGIVLSNNSSAVLENVEINTPYETSITSISLVNSHLTGVNVTVNSGSTNYDAIHVGNGSGRRSTLTLTDSSLNTAFIGIRAMNGDMQLNNVDIHTTLAFGKAIDLNFNADAVIRGGSFQTAGDYADAVIFSGKTDRPTTLDASGAIFATNGAHAHAINAQYGTATIADSVITTSGMSSYGLTTSYSITGSNLSIATSGEKSHAVVAYNGGTINLSDSEINTAGQYSVGVIGTKDHRLLLENLTVTTAGDTAHGLQVSSGEGQLSGSVLTTSGNASHGVTNIASVLDIHETTISTSGEKSNGIAVSSDGVLTAEGLTITTSGEKAAALVANRSSVTLSDAALSNTGSGSTGLYASGNATISADDLTLTSYGNASRAMVTRSASLEISDSQIETHAGSDGISIGLLAQQENNVVKLYNSSLRSETGYAVYAEDAALDLTLSNGSELEGVVRSLTSLTLDESSRWLLTGSSDVGALQQNGGSVIFSHPSDFSTLTVKGNLTGSGEFVLNTRLGDDNSATDKLLVKGDASGSYGVIVNNRGGTGALTSLGIPVISVTGSTQDASFVQRNTIVAGNYQYLLNKVSDHDWYLQSSLTPVMKGRAFKTAALATTATAQAVSTTEQVAATPVTVTAKATESAAAAVIATEILPEAQAEDIAISSPVLAYRPETAGYLIAPYLNASYGFDSVGSWHERQSARRSGAAWGRIESRRDEHDAGRFGFKVNTSFVQLGGDLLQTELTTGWHLSAGPMLTLGHQRSNNRDNARSIRPELSADVGKNVTHAYGLGGYLTAWSDEGAYLDGVIQATRYSNKFSSLTEATMNSNGVVASLEVGLPVALGGSFWLEPQLQAMGQYLNTRELNAGGVKLTAQDLTTGRMREGLRLSYDGAALKPWLQADVVQFVGRMPGAEMNKEGLKPDLRRNFWQATAGVSGKLNQRVNAYAQVKYSHSFGAGSKGYTGNVGVEYKF